MVHRSGHVKAENTEEPAQKQAPVRQNVGGENLFMETIAQQLARAARVSERRQTMHGRNWVVVFLNEKTIVIALHGSLTEAEKIQLQSPTGAARVREVHRQLFSNESATLLRQVKRLTGMEVLDLTVEFEPETCSVVHFITTNTVGEEFLSAIESPVESQGPRHGSRRRHERNAKRAPTKPLDV
jgi:uncharacterized protein YbcI